MRKIINLIFLLILFGAIPASATTHTCTTCTASDVQRLINSADIDDTIYIPSGTYSWSSTVKLNKKIHLQGADSETVSISSSVQNAIEITADGATVSHYTNTAGRIRPNGGTGWRIHHLVFNTTTGSAINATSTNGVHPEGLIDNCTFTNRGIVVYGGDDYGRTQEEIDTRTGYIYDMWEADLDLGTTNAYVYVEDCVFNRTNYGNMIDGNDGAGYVFRFNTLTGGPTDIHSLQDGNTRAGRKWEIYNNTQDDGTGTYNYIARLRAGTGVYFHNAITGSYTKGYIGLDNVRSFSSQGSFGQCNGSVAIDQNTSGHQGYACLDQIGRGPDTVQFTGSNYPNQTHSPAYAWGNTHDGAQLDFKVDSGAPMDTLHIVEDREYYNQNDSFDGSSGVGIGDRASRPSMCTSGVAYWATDQGEWNSESADNDGCLDKCTATNQWENCFYTPYTYPHPLRTGDSPGQTIIPRPPLNLRIE